MRGKVAVIKIDCKFLYSEIMWPVPSNETLPHSLTTSAMDNCQPILPNTYFTGQTNPDYTVPSLSTFWRPHYYGGGWMGPNQIEPQFYGALTNYYYDLPSVSTVAESVQQRPLYWISPPLNVNNESPEASPDLTVLRSVSDVSKQKPSEEDVQQVPSNVPQDSTETVEERQKVEQHQQQELNKKSEKQSAAKETTNKLKETKNAKISQFRAISIHLEDFEHPILLYNLPNTDRCYSFWYNETSYPCDLYFCKGCFEKSSKVVSTGVDGTFFQSNPASLSHVCEPKLLMEELSNYTSRKVKLPLKRYLIVNKIIPMVTSTKAGNLDDAGSSSRQNPKPKSHRNGKTVSRMSKRGRRSS